jgi:hypothetical protein
MAVVIIFNVAAPRAEPFVQALKALGDWGMVTDSAFLVETELAPGAVMERLHPMTGPDDDLWVFTATGPWACYGDVLAEDHAEALLGPFESWVVWDWNEARQSRPVLKD